MRIRNKVRRELLQRRQKTKSRPAKIQAPDSVEVDNQPSVSGSASETSTSNDVLEAIETELSSSQSGQGSVSTLSVDEAAQEDTIETLSTSSPSSELQLVESQSEVQSLEPRIG